MHNITTFPNQPQLLLNRRVLGALAMGGVLTACGGGGSDGDSTTPPPVVVDPPVVPPIVGMPITLPVVVQEPQDVAVREGETVHFAVDLKDEREARYQWFKNGVAIAGATDKQLVLPAAERADDQALFRVVVTNSAGSAHSRQALLKVEALAAVTGEVVPSTWSKTLPFTYLITGSSSVGKPVDRFAGVGAVSGSIYYLNKSDNRLDQYQPDGTLVRQLVLPQSTAGSKGNIEQLAVVEDPTTNEIWIALARSTSVWINTNLTAGGFIARYTAQSPQILFQSDTVTPGGLARDADGRLYFLDLRTEELVRLGPSGENLEVLSSNGVSPGAAGSSYITGFSGEVAVAGDGTAYAYLSKIGSPTRNSILRWRNGISDRVNALAGLPELEATGAVSNVGLGAYSGNVFFYVNAVYKVEQGRIVLIRLLNADGTVSTVAGTPKSTGPTQFGSPGVLDSLSGWLGITSDGRAHLGSGNSESRMFYDVQLRARG